MSYLGYLIKVGSNIIPSEYIVFDTYDCTPDQRQDVDSYRDLNQNLHRNVADEYKSIVSFKVRPNLTETKLRTLLQLIQSSYTVTKERKVHLTYWNIDTGDYDVGEFYLVQPQYRIKKATEDEIIYNSFDIKFIEY